MNVLGLTNRQLLVRALRQIVDEVERGHFLRDGCYHPTVPREMVEFARMALGEVVRNKRPESIAKLKPTKVV
jgi:hypothetical protein